VVKWPPSRGGGLCHPNREADHKPRQGNLGDDARRSRSGVQTWKRNRVVRVSLPPFKASIDGTVLVGGMLDI
jgi:hypothetical protein